MEEGEEEEEETLVKTRLSAPPARVAYPHLSVVSELGGRGKRKAPPPPPSYSQLSKAGEE